MTKSLKVAGIASVGLTATSAINAIADSPHYRQAYAAAASGDAKAADDALLELALDASLASGSVGPMQVYGAYTYWKSDATLNEVVERQKKLP